MDNRRARILALAARLTAQGFTPEKALRVAKAAHSQRAAQQRAMTRPGRAAIDGSKSELWLPPRLADERRRNTTFVEKVAIRLMDSLRLTSTIAHQIAAESARRVDHQKAEAA